MFAQMIGKVFFSIELELQKLRAGMETLLAANEEKVTEWSLFFSSSSAVCVWIGRIRVFNVLYPLSFVKLQ